MLMLMLLLLLLPTNGNVYSALLCKSLRNDCHLLFEPLACSVSLFVAAAIFACCTRWLRWWWLSWPLRLCAAFLCRLPPRRPWRRRSLSPSSSSSSSSSSFFTIVAFRRASAAAWRAWFNCCSDGWGFLEDFLLDFRACYKFRIT